MKKAKIISTEDDAYVEDMCKRWNVPHQSTCIDAIISRLNENTSMISVDVVRDEKANTIRCSEIWRWDVETELEFKAVSHGLEKFTRDGNGYKVHLDQCNGFPMGENLLGIQVLIDCCKITEQDISPLLNDIVETVGFVQQVENDHPTEDAKEESEE